MRKFVRDSKPFKIRGIREICTVALGNSELLQFCLLIFALGCDKSGINTFKLFNFNDPSF